MIASRTLALVLILVALGTAFFVVKPDPPEMVRAVSEDGLARVEALFHQGGGVRLRGVTLRLKHVDGGPATSRVSPIYEIIREGGYGELGGTFSLVSDLDSSSHVLGYWDTDENAWSVQDVSTYLDGVFSSRTTLSFPTIRWALFQRQDVEIPRRYEEIVAELIEHRPSESHRVHINLAYAFEPDDYVSLRSARVVGGCGGGLSGGGSVTKNEEIVEPTVLHVNDNDRDGWIRVSAKWDLGHGCAEGDVFERVE